MSTTGSPLMTRARICQVPLSPNVTLHTASATTGPRAVTCTEYAVIGTSQVSREPAAHLPEFSCTPAIGPCPFASAFASRMPVFALPRISSVGVSSTVRSVVVGVVPFAAKVNSRVASGARSVWKAMR